MSNLVILRLTKHFKANVAGEVCSFPPETAAHILKNQGAEKLAELKDGERYDVETGKVVKLEPDAPGSDVAAAAKREVDKARKLAAEIEAGAKRAVAEAQKATEDAEKALAAANARIAELEANQKRK